MSLSKSLQRLRIALTVIIGEFLKIRLRVILGDHEEPPNIYVRTDTT